MIGGIVAVAGLTWREAWRGRLWLVPLGAAALIAIAAPQVDAADAGGAVRLLAAVTTAAAGFCGVLLAALVPAAQTIRDFDTRIAVTMLPKPLSRLGWLLGRWCGTMAIAGAAGLVVAAVGAVAVAWRAGAVPEMRSTVAAADFRRVTGLGESVATSHAVVRLVGPAGDGARWRFVGLDAGRAADYEVLVQAQCSAAEGGPIDSAPVRLSAISGDGRVVPLVLDVSSPFGRAPADAIVPGANCWLADRSEERRSLASDWARLRLPADAVTTSGTLTVQLDRLDAATAMQVSMSGCAVAVPAGPQPWHAFRAVLAELAGPAVVAATALAVAPITALPVALLAALTMAFAGHALWAVREALGMDEVGRTLARLLGLLLRAVPDLSTTGQGARLAAGEAVGWDAVASAWLGVAPHLVILLAFGWWALRRREL